MLRTMGPRAGVASSTQGSASASVGKKGLRSMWAMRKWMLIKHTWSRVGEAAAPFGETTGEREGHPLSKQGYRAVPQDNKFTSSLILSFLTWSPWTSRVSTDGLLKVCEPHKTIRRCSHTCAFFSGEIVHNFHRILKRVCH